MTNRKIQELVRELAAEIRRDEAAREVNDALRSVVSGMKKTAPFHPLSQEKDDRKEGT